MIKHPFDAGKARKAHLSHFLELVSPQPPESLPNSLVPPNAYWTSKEKATFFRSLARHSRWRPDLIAEDVGGGKTTMDVCSYIELLEQGSARNPVHFEFRNTCPGAHEVSENWVAVESAVADKLCDEEVGWVRSALKRKRRAELRGVRDSLYSGKETASKNDSEDQAHASPRINWREKYPVVSEEENNVLAERFRSRKQELTRLWKREDRLSSLDNKCLGTLAGMIYSSEDLQQGESAPLDLSSMDSHTLQQQSFSGPLNTQGIHNSQKNSVPVPPGQPVGTTYLVNQRLESVSSSPERDYHADGRVLSVLPRDDLYSAVPITDNNDGHPSFARAKTPSSEMLSQPLVAARSHDLSPASRRRLRKRLWMRRKRALEKGMSPSEVPMDDEVLQRGRKPKPKAQDLGNTTDDGPVELDATKLASAAAKGSSKHASDEVNPSSTVVVAEPELTAGEEEVEADDETNFAPKRKGYGWKHFHDLQISGESLQSDGLDIFHLGKFASLMSMLRDVHTLSLEPGETDASTASAFSYDVLRLFRACLVHFVTQLLARVIIHKNVETRQKRRIRAISDSERAQDVRTVNVCEALLQMGRDATTEPVFHRLRRLVRNALAMQDPEEYATSEPGGLDEDSDNEIKHDTFSEGTPPVPAKPVAQHPLPPVSADSTAVSFWNPAIFRSGQDGQDKDIALSDDMDEVALEEELKAEKLIEDQDLEVDRKHEGGLWLEIDSAKR